VASKPKRVLVVEDDIGMKIIMMCLLHSIDRSLQIHWVVSGEEALNELKEKTTLFHEPYDLVISDIVLAGETDGVELWRTCKKMFPETRFIFASGVPEEEVKEKVGKTNAPPLHLSKPFEIERWQSTLESLLSQN